MVAKLRNGIKAILRGLASAYYLLKFLPFRAERRTFLRQPGGTGLVIMQIDGLSYDALQEAFRRGYAPHLARRLGHGESVLLPYRCGVPSSTPCAQAGIFFGKNDDIPAFRWYEKPTRRIVSCNNPDAAQLIRSRLAGLHGLLEGGSSYGNMLDGGAACRVFTLSSPGAQSFFDRLGRFHLPLLLMAHPVRVMRAVFAFFAEIATELVDRYLLKTGEARTAAEGFFPVIRAFCTAVMTEVETVGTLADMYVGRPIIYSTYIGYDELAHHFGPTSTPAMKHLRYLDGRIRELSRMINYLPGRSYRLVVLSDHGQTAAVPFETLYGCTFGMLVSNAASKISLRLVGGAATPFVNTGAQMAGFLESIGRRQNRIAARVMRRTAWSIRRRTGIERLLPENYFVDERNELVITYSSSLAHLYFSKHPARLSSERIAAEYHELLLFLCSCRGVGAVFMVSESGDVVVKGSHGECRVSGGRARVVVGVNPLDGYCLTGDDVASVERMVRFSNAGDVVLFGAMIGGRVVCFDDQVGAHGSMGGGQDRPFLLLPSDLPAPDIRDARDLYPFFMRARGAAVPTVPPLAPPN